MTLANSDFPTERILRTLREGRAHLTAAGLPLEPDGVGLSVEQHRWAWKPSRVRVILVAESHVYTSADDFALRVKCERLPDVARHAPTEFVRLVYCLGYGETSILSGRPSTRNSGTPQFWNIFGRLARTGRQPTTLRATWHERVQWKVGSLRALQDAGVWLIDAALHGIYAPGATRVQPAVTFRLQWTWWTHYGSWLFDQHPDAYRCVIGRGVARSLEALGVRFDGWIYQPQARASSGTDLEAGWGRLLEASHR